MSAHLRGAACAVAIACAVAAARAARAQVFTLPTASPGGLALATDASRDADDDAWIPQISTAGRLRMLQWNGFGLEGMAEAMALLPGDGRGSGRAIGGARLTYAASGAGVWAGAGTGGASHDGRGRALFLAEAGGRLRWRGAGVSFNVRQTQLNGIPATYHDSLVAATDTSAAWHLVTLITPKIPARRYTEAELLMHLAAGAVALEARAGGRLERGKTRALGWAQAAADVTLSRRVALTLAAGRLRGTPELASRPAPFLSLALRLVPGRGAPTVRTPAQGPIDEAPAFDVSSDGTVRTLTVRVPAATRVELKADFTDWQPRSLAPGDEPGTWRVTLPVPPGTYHVNLRVDGGEWIAPPGLPDLEDEFGGRVGLLVIG